MEVFLELIFWDNQQLPCRIHLDLLDVLKSPSFQVGSDFWKEEKVARGKISGVCGAVGLGGCRAWPKTAAQAGLNGQVCCHGAFATHQMHAILAFSDE